MMSRACYAENGPMEFKLIQATIVGILLTTVCDGDDGRAAAASCQSRYTQRWTISVIN